MLWASGRWPIGKFEISTLWGALHIWGTIELQNSVLPNHYTLIYIVIIPPSTMDSEFTPWVQSQPRELALLAYLADI